MSDAAVCKRSAVERRCSQDNLLWLSSSPLISIISLIPLISTSHHRLRLALTAHWFARPSLLTLTRHNSLVAHLCIALAVFALGALFHCTPYSIAPFVLSFSLCHIDLFVSFRDVTQRRAAAACAPTSFGSALQPIILPALLALFAFPAVLIHPSHHITQSTPPDSTQPDSTPAPPRDSQLFSSHLQR